MFGYTVIRRAALDDLQVTIGQLRDEVNLKERVFQELNTEATALSMEYEALKAKYAGLKTEHDALVDLTLDPSTPEAQRSHIFAVGPVSVPDATGHSN